MHEIHRIMPEDAMQLAALRAAAYGMQVDPEKVKYPDYEMLGAYEDGKLQASVAIRPYECRWGNTYLPALGVGGVATLPLSRRSGLIRSLFGELDRLSVERGWAFGMLYPFSYRYYRQFGYEQILPRVTITVPFSDLTGIERNADGEVYDGSQKEALLALYHRYADAHPMMARRTGSHLWREAPEQSVCFTYLHRGPEGFDACAVVTYQKDSVDAAELLYTTPESLRGIIGMLRLYDGQRKLLRFVGLPERTPVWELMREYKLCTRDYTNGAMGRVLNTGRLLETNIWPDAPGRFALEVRDALPGCAGTYEVEYAAGRAEVRRTDAAGDIVTDAPALARILLSGAGYGADELAFLPNVTVRDPARAADLARAFPRRPAELMEHF